MTIDLFEDNAGGLHIVDRSRGIGFHGFERGQNLAAYRVTGRTEFTLASDAPAFDDLGEGSLYEPTDAADIEALYRHTGERDAAELVARWEDGEVTLLVSNLGAAARWYLEIA